MAAEVVGIGGGGTLSDRSRGDSSCTISIVRVCAAVGSKPVATTVTLISSPSDSSMIAPKIVLVSAAADS